MVCGDGAIHVAKTAEAKLRDGLIPLELLCPLLAISGHFLNGEIKAMGAC